MRINNLIARFLVNKTTKEEWDTLESWKEESKDNLNELLEMQSIWQNSVDLKGYKNYDKKSAWDLVNDQLDSDEVVEPIVEEKKSRSKFLTLKWASGIAASAAVLVFALYSINPEIPEGYNHVASNGVIENITLPDGSDIFINKNSELDYASQFLENRSIILEGEAYFDVARNESKPFTIKTNEADITVLGTSFNIEEKKNYVDVYVTSGKVKVSTGSEEVILTKHDMVRCANGKIEKLKSPGSNYLSWKSKKLVFQETPLHQVTGDLGRHFNKKIVFSGSSKAMNQQVTDSFENEDFESVLETLVLITGIKYLKEGNTYVIQ